MSNNIEMTTTMEKSWLKITEEEFKQPYMKVLKAFLLEEEAKDHVIYPKNQHVFNAFQHTPFEQVKVVILGQDPYHGDGQAHGLSFSVEKGIKIPPSLKNIYKELNTDIQDFQIPHHGNLTSWADQGVLLLNATLTVRAKEPGSHQGKGWETFTDQIIRTISQKRKGVIFLLWGKYAQQKSVLIDEAKHTIFKTSHPSPFSAYQGFLGCKHFSKTNTQLKIQGLLPIDWKIPD